MITPFFFIIIHNSFIFVDSNSIICVNIWNWTYAYKNIHASHNDRYCHLPQYCLSS